MVRPENPRQRYTGPGGGNPWCDDQDRGDEEHHPKVSLTVLDPDDPGSHVSMQGRITLQDDPDLSGIDRLAVHYAGKPYPDRERPRVNGWIEIEYWHVWGRLS